MTIGPIARRFNDLSQTRQAKLDRARELSAFTIPSILPFSGFSESQGLVLPYSSMAARGCMFLASKIHAAMIPMNDLPFIEIRPRYGMEISQKSRNTLKNITQVAHESLMSGNLRSVFNEAVLHLLVVGDCLLFLEEDFNYRLYRLDQYVVVRDVTGVVHELIVCDWDLADTSDRTATEGESASLDPSESGKKQGYVPVYTRLLLDSSKTKYTVSREREGKPVVHPYDKGPEAKSAQFYSTSANPYIVLRWNAMPGENYGRSYCEELYGDIKANEKYTEALHYGMVGAASWWMGYAPDAGVDADVLAAKPIGQWARVDPSKVGVIAPAKELNSQIATMLEAVQESRNTLTKAFLMTGEALPTGDRVTATQIKAVMIELEQVLGGNFSGLAKDLFVPSITYTLNTLLEKKILEPKFKDLLFGTDKDISPLKYDIITGLQAIGKDSDNTKLMQFLETLRNVPETMLEKINYDTLLDQLIRSFGFPPNDWVIPDNVVNQRRQAQLAAEAQAQAALQQQKNMGSVAAAVAPKVAEAAMGQAGPPQPQ